MCLKKLKRECRTLNRLYKKYPSDPSNYSALGIFLLLGEVVKCAMQDSHLSYKEYSEFKKDAENFLYENQNLENFFDSNGLSGNCQMIRSHAKKYSCYTRTDDENDQGT